MKAPQLACNSCGAVANKWSGQCAACGEWNTISEQELPSPLIRQARKKQTSRLNNHLSNQMEVLSADEALSKTLTPRIATNLSEFNNVLGGGLVAGSVLLVGGEPGIGKSTLLLQVLAGLEQHSLYISGEEFLAQIAERGKRLELNLAKLKLATQTEIGSITAVLDKNPAWKVVVVDSIQTMYVQDIESPPGSVLQLRATTAEFVRIARKYQICVIIIGHVTKEGYIAGPKVLEHIVDTVLYFESQSNEQYRIIRTIKNRYGASGELGIFEMTNTGLHQLADPTAVFLPEERKATAGSVTFCGMEGHRPLLLEVQALVAPAPSMVPPRRSSNGWSKQRLAMVLAVLEIKCGVKLSAKEVYLNITGGLQLKEPAVDFAAACAILSSLSNVEVDPQTIIFGELGLSGELRPVTHMAKRLHEASKRGFKGAIIPDVGAKRLNELKNQGLAISAFNHIKEYAVSQKN